MNIREIILQTRHLEQQKTFYTQTMGLPSVKDAAHSFTVQAGESLLSFESSAAADGNPFYHFAFDIPGNQVDESVAWLQSRGISLNVLPQDQDRIYSESWNATSVYFYDPAGSLVEFIARHNLGRSSSDPFGAGSLLTISEIGLVVHDVPSVQELLGARFSLPPYKDYTPTFAAIGDEHGLFILSAYNRIWRGSDKEAKVYKTEVIVEGGPASGELSFPGYPYKLTARSRL